MYPVRKFNAAETAYSTNLRLKMQEVEGMVRCIAPSRERSLALTKLDEALFWTNAAIAAEDIERVKTPTSRARDAGFGQTADAVRYGIEQYAPKREETDLQISIANAVRKGLDEAQEQFANECNTMNAKLGLYRAMLAELEKGGQNE